MNVPAIRVCMVAPVRISKMGFSADVLKAQVVCCQKIDLYRHYLMLNFLLQCWHEQRKQKMQLTNEGHLLFYRISFMVYSTDVDRTEWQFCVRRI